MTQPTPQDALRLCPFCGGAGTFVKHSAGIRGTAGFDSWHAVACKACGGTVGASDRRFRDKGDAAKAWNTRATAAAEAALAAKPVAEQDAQKEPAEIIRALGPNVGIKPRRQASA
jgi:Lar family restriction alleviation protein